MFVECSHRVCGSCFERMKEHAERGILLCPYDRIEVDGNKVFEDQAISRTILDFKVNCENHAVGCGWIGELRQLEEHLNDKCVVNENKRLLQMIEISKKELLEKDQPC